MLVNVGNGIIFHISFNKEKKGFVVFSWGFEEGQDIYRERFVNDTGHKYQKIPSGLFSIMEPIIIAAIGDYLRRRHPKVLGAMTGDIKRSNWMLKIGREHTFPGYTFRQSRAQDQWGGIAVEWVRQ